MAIKAAEASYPVAFDFAMRWLERLTSAHSRGLLERDFRKWNRYRLLVTDEDGYLPFDSAAASLFFQLIASRYETGSLLVTSNLAFSRWGETLGDHVVVAATIDRLVHHAQLIAPNGESYGTGGHRIGQRPVTAARNKPPSTTRSAGKGVNFRSAEGRFAPACRGPRS